MHPEERLAVELDRGLQRRVEREPDRELQQHREAPAERVHLVLLVELHRRDVELLAVGPVLQLQLLDLGLELPHLVHRPHRLRGEREEQHLHEHREQDDREAPVVDDVLEPAHHVEQDAREERERAGHRAVVDGALEPAPVGRAGGRDPSGPHTLSVTCAARRPRPARAAPRSRCPSPARARTRTARAAPADARRRRSTPRPPRPSRPSPSSFSAAGSPSEVEPLGLVGRAADRAHDVERRPGEHPARARVRRACGPGRGARSRPAPGRPSPRPRRRARTASR